MAPATEHENTENNKVILGATGVTDLQIVKQVLERDYQITAPLRNLSKSTRGLTAVLSALGYAMATAQPLYDYSAYDYSYEAGAATASYASYPGYESSASYATPGAYDGYAASGGYPPGTATGPSYSTVDPYSGYATTGYGYPTTATSVGGPPPTSSQPGYPSSNSSYPYESRRTPPPSSSSAASAIHYAGYDYSSAMSGSYAPTPSSATTYSPYKTISTSHRSTPQNDYATYAISAPPSHGAYSVQSGSQAAGTMGSTHGYATATADMVARQSDYYHSSQVPPAMHYIRHQPQRMPYRLPPRGGYQRELDEPGDENDLLRHVIYVTGLPKEIQNETLAEVFGSACGLIAPVDVRSPKPKIWVYKDRQTREGKGEATITFINPESCQVAVNYFDGKELFGRQIRVALCPRRLYSMQKQNTPFNPAAPPMNTTTSMLSMIKSTSNNNNNNEVTSIPSTSSVSTIITTGTSPSPIISTTTASSNFVTAANPITTISSSTLGLPRQMNHSLFKFRQTPEQQRGILPTPPNSFVAPVMSNAFQRDGVRKELPRVALNRGNAAYPAGVRPKPY
ncbi:unnamed protein product [Rotaria socialis]|uniref:RRM domain-containing protein n=2 Tax=Rotaria socialis TaxID=392032 RepID=A0A820S365_9BILA|nr:unnamed protein product [Rotaria socialis]CAF4445290.1 unnamed protein product [Rotaria socialis]CAF4533418.1 unnamed protein product [Rotaria socialis]CAF4670621.1 unnamed protein product [Rotaria socialis]